MAYTGISREEAAKSRTAAGKNYNGGKYVNPYMSDNKGQFWGGVVVIVCFIVLPLMAG